MGSDVSPAELDATAAAERGGAATLRRALLTALIAAVGCWAVLAGVELREWVWRFSDPVKFGDIKRGFRYGKRAHEQGYLDLYERVLVETEGRYNELDYAPFRLAVMGWWAGSALARYPDSPEWRWEWRFTEPAMRFNMGLELWGALGAGLLAGVWSRRGGAGPSKARLIGLAAGLFLWFNPAMMWNAYGWPGWDTWVVPFFLWAVLLASWERWTLSGLVLGLGAGFKGQQWIVAPWFVMVPLFMDLRPWRGTWGRSLRWLIGAILAVSIIALPWMLTTRFDPEVIGRTGWEVRSSVRPAGATWINAPAVGWVLVVLAAALLAGLRRWAIGSAGWRGVRVAPGVLGRCGIAVGAPTEDDPSASDSGGGQRRRRCGRMAMGGLWVLAMAMAWGAVMWRWLAATHERDAALASPWVGLAMALLCTLGCAAVTPRWWVRLAGLSVALALLLCVPMFDASTAWFRIGWAYGTHHWPWMVMGLTSNIPGILTRRFGFDNKTDLLRTLFTIPAGSLWLWPREAFEVSMKSLLASIYFVTLLLSALGGARHWNRRDPRFLIAATAPWLLMFTILGQVHERYLLFAAGSTAVLLAVHWRWALLSAFLSVITFAMTAHVMLGSSRRWWDARRTGLPIGMEDGIRPEWAAKLYGWVGAMHPDAGWGVAVCAAVMLLAAVGPVGRAARGDRVNEPPRRQDAKADA